VIITGSSGFIGERLYQRCLEEDRRVIPVPDPIERDTTFDCADGVFVHLGAEPGIRESVKDPIGCFQANTVSTVEYLSLAVDNRLKRFLFASSAAVTTTPATPYAASKAASEAWCWAFAQTFGLEALIMRFSNVYGPGSDEKTSVVAQMCRDALNAGEIVVHGDGHQLRDFIHVDDVCDAILVAALSDTPYIGQCNICTGEQHEVNAIAEIIAGATGAVVRRTDIDTGGDANTMERTSVLPWAPVRELESGVLQTLGYFRGDA